MSKVFLFNPYTGTPRHPLDIQSDPEGLAIVEPGEPLHAAQQEPPSPAPAPTAEQAVALLTAASSQCEVCNALIVPRNVTHYDALDLAAAQERAKILHSRIVIEHDEQAAPAPEQGLPDAYEAVESQIVGRFRVEKRTGGGFWPYAVKAGDGTGELFVGHKTKCEEVAQALQTACLDGAYMAARSQPSPPVEPVAEVAQGHESFGFRLLADTLPPDGTKLYTAPPQTDWVLAMAQALGTDSGYAVPIVPSAEQFRRLFDAVRAAEALGAARYRHIREDSNWPAAFGMWPGNRNPAGPLRGEALDAEVDRAIAATNPKP